MGAQRLSSHRPGQDRFDIPTLGTLGLLLRAKARGLIASAGRAIQDVREAGLHLDDVTVAAALRQIGEQWQP